MEDRFIRTLDVDRYNLALNRSIPSDRFEELVDLLTPKFRAFLAISAQIALLFACQMTWRTCGLVTHVYRLGKEALERLQREKKKMISFHFSTYTRRTQSRRGPPHPG